MTRLNTPTRFNGADAPRRVVAVHRQGDQFNIVLAEQRNGRAQVVEHQSVPARDSARLATLLARLAPERVVRVLPGGSMVCRVIEIPPLEEAAAIEAAQLQAEADLPSMLAAHRRGTALLPWRTSVDNRVAAAFGWPGERPLDFPESIDNLSYCGEAASLIELLIHSGINEGTIAALDRDHHSMELASHLMGVTTVRTARLSENQWSAEAARVVVETVLGAGADEAVVDEIEQRIGNAARTQRQTLVIDADLAGRLSRVVSGANTDTAWWSRFGIAVGAALAALGPRRAMVELCDQPPQVPRGIVVSTINWISDRQRARNVAMLALLLIIVVPILGGWTRYAILKYKTRHLDEVKAAFKERQAEADFFRTLRNHRWPMTKLLADISGMAPYGLSIDSISIDGSQLVTISGTAELGEQNDVLAFHRQLNESHLFDEVKSPNFTFGDDKIEFELQGMMANPLAKVERTSSKPLAEVIYGEEAKGMKLGEYVFNSFSLGGANIRPRSTPRPSPSGNSENGSMGGSPFSFPSSGSGGAAATPDSSSARSAAPQKAPPAPLSDEDISKMDEAAVQNALLARAALKHSDPRLQAEWDKLVERKRELTTGGASAEEDFEP